MTIYVELNIKESGSWARFRLSFLNEGWTICKVQQRSLGEDLSGN